MELIIIIGLVLLNGVFAMSEMSLVASRKFKLESLKKKGNSNAKTALELSENPTRFLSTVQIGITLIGVLLGVYSGENLTTDLKNFLSQYVLLAPYAASLSTILIVVFITYLSIVFGELFPKRLGMKFPETIIVLLAKPMSILSKITSPFVWLLSTSNNLLLKIFGISGKNDETMSEEEIKSIIAESTVGGEIQEIEQEIVRRVFELGDRKVTSLMTHRPDIVYLKISDTWDEVRAKINEEKHSAYPVCSSKGLDEILGIVLIKDLFVILDRNEFSLEKFIKKPVFFNENSDAFKVLENFKREGTHYGFIVDEYGVISGIVTMDDVLDALVGDVSENSDEDQEIVQRSENSWLVDGQYSAFEFIKSFEIELDYELSNQYSTVGGMFMFHVNDIPNVGDRIQIGQYELEIVDKDGQRIDKIMLTKSS
ncbi:hemolysin family protein [Sphingobacterium sp. JUb56]|uniref:hemolysin family protein n=1 Tax=Sphingobacterium sp. JUb56 TaxID=2587145 RepID=UPI00160B40FB|nr:hemolysin family protein [Sphingobacterium sp. JUb56]MBB2950732.1 putative hemolysin [Sphingobacterium sp. JUb56]